MTKIISLVLATLNRSTELLNFFTSICKSDMTTFEVIVVDQNDDDRLVPIVRQALLMGIDVKHIRHAIKNLSSARNAGIAVAQGSWIGFPDDDCWYEEETISAVLHEINQDDVDGIVANWVEANFDIKSVCTTDELLDLQQWRNFRGGNASSISIFMKKSVFEIVHGFDVQFGVGEWFGCGEETDFILRVLSHHKRIRRCHRIKVHHHYGTVQQQTFTRAFERSRHRERGTGALYAKHNLSSKTIVRGLMAPLVKSILTRGRSPSISIALGTTIGRIEGIRKWKMKTNQRPTPRR